VFAETAGVFSEGILLGMDEFCTQYSIGAPYSLLILWSLPACFMLSYFV
jgi:hypothetical protein